MVEAERREATERLSESREREEAAAQRFESCLVSTAAQLAAEEVAHTEQATQKARDDAAHAVKLVTCRRALLRLSLSALRACVIVRVCDIQSSP